MGAVDVQELIEGTLAGDEAAWQLLWQEVEPTLYAMMRSPQVLGRLSRSEDDCRNIVVEVMARLRAHRFARLARHAETRRARPTLPFLGWLRAVAPQPRVRRRRTGPRTGIAGRPAPTSERRTNRTPDTHVSCLPRSLSIA